MLKFKLTFLLILILFSIENTLRAQDNVLSKAKKQEGWQLLFDGKTTAGWKGAFTEKFPTKGWKIENGLLEVDANGGAESADGGDIVTLKEYDNFELKVDFKLTEGANSGIKYFEALHQTTPASPRSAFGLEFQLLDDAVHPDAKLGKNGNRTISSLYDLIPAIDNKPTKYGSRYKLMHVKDLRKGVLGDLTGATPVENTLPLVQDK